MARLEDVTDEDLEREGLIDLSADPRPVMPHRTKFDLALERSYELRRKAMTENRAIIFSAQTGKEFFVELSDQSIGKPAE